MSSRELGPEWVLSRFILQRRCSRRNHRISCRRQTPLARIQSYARKEQPEKNFDEAMALATEVWEGVLQSVAKTFSDPTGKIGELRTWKLIFSVSSITGSTEL